MSRARYYIDLNRPQAWQRKPWAKRVTISLGIAAFTAGFVTLCVGLTSEGDFDLWFFAFQMLAWGPMMLFQSFDFGKRFFGRFVDIRLGSVRWRLATPDGSLRAEYHDVPLARVRDVRVGVLRIDFVMDDGTLHAMPLGELPYEAVRAIKSRFEGRESLAGATGVAMEYAG